MRAIGYSRISKSSEGGLSLKAQERQIRAYCTMKRWKLVAVLSDDGESGKDLKRPGITAALDLLDRHEATVLVVAKLDRLTRSVMDFERLTRQRFVDNGASFVSIAESFDTSTAAGRGLMGVLVQFGQMEREMIGERTKAALAELKRQGVKLGARPRFAGAAKASEVRMVRRLTAEGLSLRQIGRARGYSAPTAGRLLRGGVEVGDSCAVAAQQ